MRSSLAALTVTALLVPDAYAQDEKNWSLDVGVDYSSHYLFRGVSLLGDNGVVDRHLTYTAGNFNVYYNWLSGAIPATFTSSGRTVSFHEHDFGADYSFVLSDKFRLTLGAVAYTYSSKTRNEYDAEATYELYAVAAFDVLFSPTVSYYRDMAAVKGGYGSIGVGRQFELGNKVSPEFSAAVGFDFGYNSGSGMTSDPVLDESNGGFNDLLVGIDIPIQINQWLSAHASVQRSFALRVLDDLYAGDETVFVVGVDLTL